MKLQELTKPWAAFNYGFLDESAKRELRRSILKAIAVPGYQVPYASREVPMARGWGTGGLQVTLTLLKPTSVVKVIDQGADDSVNAVSIRKFFNRVGGCGATEDTLEATIIQSRHRIPEEKLRDDQVLVLQVPDPEPLRAVQSDMSITREMHGDADYGQLWLVLYEQLVKSGRIMQGSSYPSLVNGRYVISPSPIPRWDVKKLHQSAHLTILSAGREKRLYVVPPFTDVEPLVFDDVPYRIEDHADKTCYRTQVTGFFVNELPQDDGSARFELSDSHFGVKHIKTSGGEMVAVGDTWYKNGKMD
ncbi:alpha-D-ribose 1-methylphosphonate 5-phosphate C-P-lyase PhnJ [Rhizobium mayense]|uniref:Alpha-D-ribose 1-methylphosphonate 5-phosphate C-P lyase n=1 Tax=Rhizobium mayense TaxID=1312184 RepID=A0ABT7K0H7_9HYPH|nr:alpha-D-ribose 1-methylphosphonate 5-phosphate C-P-lyase PhnJ [Rhizobium mayense]MDL2402082.1 alpha-D-ribose 1-methylphosphonate 5-phosphate C-P-lyase PhnJ [Rhizobium mayense]